MFEQQPKNQEIREMLIQLHDELERTQTLDENERSMMRHLINDIQEALNRQAGSDQPPAEPTIITRLEKAVSLLEVEHPTLTAAIQKALDTLNVAGI